MTMRQQRREKDDNKATEERERQGQGDRGERKMATR